MKFARFHFACCAIAGLFFAPCATAQFTDSDEPRWLRLEMPRASAGMEIESVSETIEIGGNKSTHEQLSLSPLVGLETRGSIYHPNLLRFDWSGETGWSWLFDSVDAPGSHVTRNENGDVLRYLANVTLLGAKPYNATFTASQDHTYRNYDSFTTYTVDTMRYGGRVGWRAEKFSLNADVGYRDEHSSGINGTTDVAETYVDFSGVHIRDRGQSSLTYRYNLFDTALNGGATLSSENHSVGISDSEVFGARRQIRMTTSASYSQYEYSSQQTETITAAENVTITHNPRLESFLNANYSHSETDPVESSYFQGLGGVRHRLFESLTTTLEAHGSYDESSGPDGSSYNDRYGLGLHEDYTKRLANWGRLSVGGAIIADRENHHASGGVLSMFDEVHNLFLTSNPNFRPVYLNQPRVIVSTIQVRGPGGVPVQLNVDYEIISTGQLTEIRLLFGSAILHDGDAVTVSYQAESLYTSAFESFNGNVQIRLDLFDRFGIYGRLNWLDNNAPPIFPTQTLLDLVGGVEFRWRNFRAGAEYEDYDSNFIQYDAFRFFQGYTWQPTATSLLNVDLTETFYGYRDTGDQDRYQIITRYNTQLPFALSWYVEGGYAWQTVLGSEQDYGFARTGLTWTRGKLSARAGYDYNYQMTSSGGSTEERQRHFLYLYLKRVF